MATKSRRHALLHLLQRSPVAAPEPLPADRVIDMTWLQLPDLTRRNPAATTTTCAKRSGGSGCESSGSPSTATVAIAVGIVVPITIAIIVFIFLHRRHVKKQRIEDADDRHKSLDFGMDPSDAPMAGRKKNNAKQEMALTENALRRGRGLSMDIGNPYLLPPGLQSSRESFHSLSRTINNGDDPYRPATTFIPNDTSSGTSQASSRRGDDSSSYTGSSGRGKKQDSMNQNLLRNAQRMSRSAPPAQRTAPSNDESNAQTGSSIENLPERLPSNQRGAKQMLNTSSKPHDSYTDQNGADLRSSNNYLGAFIHSRDPSIDQQSQGSSPKNQEPPESLLALQHAPLRKSPPPAITVTSDSLPPPRKQSLPPQVRPSAQRSINLNGEHHENIEKFTTPLQAPSPIPVQVQLPDFSMPNSEQSTPFYTPGLTPFEHAPDTNTNTDLGYDPRRMSILRPLPPDDPTDNPEQRANRIRSFYKEYFDDSRPVKAYAPAPEVYYEDYGEEFQGEGTVVDQTTGQFIVAKAPYAEPVTRRAMTPPPRAPPRFQGPSRHQPISSSPRSVPGRSRAFSSASARVGSSNRAPPSRPLPPPSALRTLPTPYLLQEDAFFGTIEFAPPSSYRDRQAGRPNSPRSELRPYSPQILVHTPLASALNELPVMPSPYQLRKSGSFTALDFAPPPRFKNSDTGSDAGSIRSGRSNGSAMSAAQIHSIRSGAYRVSRIPKEMVGTKLDIQESLKPTWSLRS